MGVSPCSGRNLFFCLFLAGVSDSRTDRPGRNSPGGFLPSGSRAHSRALAAFLVCTHGALDLDRAGNVECIVLGRHGGFGLASAEPLASRDAGPLLGLFSFLHSRGPGLLQLPIRRDVARSRIHFVILCATRVPSRVGANPSRFACQSFPSAVGMVPDLLRVRDGENPEWRSRMAPFHCDG